MYVRTAGTHKWSALRNKRRVKVDSPGVLNWLASEGPVAFSAANLEWLDKAINYVLGKCVNSIGVALTGVTSCSFTLMDRLAYVLKKGIDLSKNISDLVLSLIRKMMKILGMNAAIERVDATYAFIRSIFRKLSQRISAYCQQVLDTVLVNGRSA